MGPPHPSTEDAPPHTQHPEKKKKKKDAGRTHFGGVHFRFSHAFRFLHSLPNDPFAPPPLSRPSADFLKVQQIASGRRHQKSVFASVRLPFAFSVLVLLTVSASSHTTASHCWCGVARYDRPLARLP